MPCEEEEDEINPAYGRTDDRAPDTFCERYRGRSVFLPMERGDDRAEGTDTAYVQSVLYLPSVLAFAT